MILVFSVLGKTSRHCHMIWRLCPKKTTQITFKYWKSRLMTSFLLFKYIDVD